MAREPAHDISPSRLAALAHGTALTFLALLLGACAADPQLYSSSDVVHARPTAYSSIRSISGYLRFGSHSRQLWNDQRALANNDASKCVTLANTLPFEDRLRALDRSRIEIEGFPVQDVLSGRADFGACNKVGFYVRNVRPLTR